MDLKKIYSSTEQKFFDLCKKVVEEQGLKLYDMEYLASQKILRVYIFNEQTKTAVIEDCSKVDRAFDPYFENNDWIPELTLEVSSPGMFRNLKKLDHFQAAVGQNVQVILNKKINEEKNPGLEAKYYKESKFRLIVTEATEENLTANLNGKIIKIDWDAIKKANLDPDF